MFTYDDGEVLQGVSFNGNYPEEQRRNVLRTLPMRPEVLQRINWRDGILTEEAEKVTFEMFWDRYNDKARSSRVKTQRVWDKCRRANARRHTATSTVTRAPFRRGCA